MFQAVSPTLQSRGVILTNLGLKRQASSQQWLLYCHASTITKGASKHLPPPPPPQPKDIEEQDEDHTPKPLTRPLGHLSPPRIGENSGVDFRTWRERRDDFFNYDKHLERRKTLTKAVSKPYFHEWSNMRFYKGKTFLANPKLFRAEKALYFPNLQGATLASPGSVQDTTTVLSGKISVVAMFCGAWAEHQTKTFVDKHPELDAVLQQGNGMVQRVDINVEENAMKAGLIKLFMGGLRRKLPLEAHGRYFLVRRGLTEDIRDEIGLLNSKVGYVYLVDSQCRIRWAGSGPAKSGERESLVRGIAKLLQDGQKRMMEQRVEEQKVSPAIENQPSAFKASSV